LETLAYASPRLGKPGQRASRPSEGSLRSITKDAKPVRQDRLDARND